ncbi:hypothetical protein QUA07_28855 [Microcoleus sp. T3_A4]|uniref:hypothetical protein n=1 Tax=Microcoleus sp. T3_A4 TaxID=2818968 RepID=UPI002FD31B1E
MAIPSVMQGLIETDGGKVFELDSPKGATWLESVGSFRYEPTGDGKPYTVRKETGKGGDYWYGYRKMAGRLHKKYIGKSSEISTAKLEEIAEALNTPPQPRVTDRVTEVTDTINQSVTDRVTDAVTVEEFTALKSQVQLLQESLEALRSELPGKSDAGNFEELPTVTDSELQIELGNSEYDHALTTPEEALAQAKIFGFTPEEALADAHFQIAMLTANYDELEDRFEAKKRELAELRLQLETERADREEIEAELSDLKQKSAPAKKLPDTFIFLNELKAAFPRTKFAISDAEKILGILEKL